jgi:Iap family predicted aminopeptidase
MDLTNFEKSILGDISKKRFWADVVWFAEKGEKLSGTSVNEVSVDYIIGKLKEAGVSTEAPEFQAWLGFPNLFDAEVKILEPEKKALNCISLAQCASGAAEGDLIYIGGGGLKDYSEVNARNKIVLVDFSLPPARPWKNYLAGVVNGAVGQIVISHKGPKRALNRGTVKSVWGNSIPENINDIGRIPVVNICREDGEYLKGLLEKGPVRIKMEANGRRGFYRTRQPMARVNGRDTSFVLLGSHMDAWGAAASCNALGCASTLEAARILKKHQAELKRGLQMLWFQGHETGIMTGSSWYLDNYWGDLNSNCVAYLNNDTTNMALSNIYTAEGDPILRDFLIETVRQLAEEEGAEFKAPPPRYRPYKYGDQSFLGIGIPSIRITTTFTPEAREKVGLGGGWWYHSEYDTLDKCDPETMYMAEKAQTLVIIRLCTLPVLPYRVERLADWTIDALTELEGLAEGGLSLGSLLDQAVLFKQLAFELDEATGKLSETCEKEPKLDVKVDAANKCLLKISRIMNPVNYTLRGRYDQDYYGAEYVQPIPIMRNVAELASLNPDAEEYKTLRTKLVRARNQVSDTIHEAVFITGYAVEKLR